jgi:hypothetical protein
MILKIFCIKLNIFKYIYLSIKYFFKDLKLHLVLKNVHIMDQTCLVVHKRRRPQARLKDSQTVLHTLWIRVDELGIEANKAVHELRHS